MTSRLVLLKYIMLMCKVGGGEIPRIFDGGGEISRIFFCGEPKKKNRRKKKKNRQNFDSLSLSLSLSWNTSYDQEHSQNFCEDISIILIIGLEEVVNYHPSDINVSPTFSVVCVPSVSPFPLHPVSCLWHETGVELVSVNVWRFDKVVSFFPSTVPLPKQIPTHSVPFENRFEK